MFSKKQRLSREEIKDILEKKPKKINSDNFFVRVSPTPCGIPKFSISISKKVAKLSVKRHLLKRKVVNTIKEIMESDNVTPYKYIISLKKDISNLNIVDIKEELVKILI